LGVIIDTAFSTLIAWVFEFDDIGAEESSVLASLCSELNVFERLFVGEDEAVFGMYFLVETWLIVSYRHPL